ncbi:MAG: DUF192 domain-containing protein [Candidatus Pacearchaeota archaeon]
MRKNYVRYSIFAFILILAIVIFLVVNDSGNNSGFSMVCVEDKKCFSVEIAETPEERRIGLSEHESLGEDEGMFFIFEEETRSGFWMKDMDFPIDIMWIDSDFEIIGIEENLQPCNAGNCPVVYPEEKIKYALEISSGLSDFYNFKEGDSVGLE